MSEKPTIQFLSDPNRVEIGDVVALESGKLGAVVDLLALCLTDDQGAFVVTCTRTWNGLERVRNLKNMEKARKIVACLSVAEMKDTAQAIKNTFSGDALPPSGGDKS